MIYEVVKEKDLNDDAISTRIPHEYEHFIMSMETRVDPLKVGQVKTLMLTQERRIEKIHSWNRGRGWVMDVIVQY